MKDYILLYRATMTERNEAMGDPEKAKQSMQAWLAWMRELETQGHLKNPGQPLAPEGGKVVRGDKKVVTDGPFAEKDLVLGFSIVTAEDAAHAAKLASGCPILAAPGGSVEVREVTEIPH